MSICFTLE